MSLRESSKPDLFVAARIIRTLRENNSMRRTSLATACGLAYNRLVKYLDWMSEKGFVRVDEEGFVSLTPKGEEAYEKLVKWILEHFGRLEFQDFSGRLPHASPILFSSRLRNWRPHCWLH